MERSEKGSTTTEKPVARVDYYKNSSTLDRTNIVSLNVTAPTIEEASKLFTEKLEELHLTQQAE